MPLPGRHPIEDNLSNYFDANTPVLRVRDLKWAEVQISGRPKIQLSDGRICEEDGWYSTAIVVLDKPESRLAATLGAPAEARQLLETIIRESIPVRVTGSRRNRGEPKRSDNGGCVLETVWASINADFNVKR